MAKHVIIINIVGIVLFFINFAVCLFTLKTNKQNKRLLGVPIILVVIQFIGYMEGNFLLMDTAIPNTVETRVYVGNFIIVIAVIVQAIISLRLIMNIKKSKEREAN